MATVTPTRYNQETLGGNDVALGFVWALTSANADGAPISKAAYSDLSVVATGTWGGATLTIEGSADGATWVPLKDVSGAAATLAANGSIHLQNAPPFRRPNLTTPGAGAAISVTFVARTYAGSPRD